ncbi:SPOR domain-containing protein [Pseudoroseomonas cervicalis]|uniref:SPOR domain-containing protein n=1 Tax=Teichococcus cervicalis TaxID=204525 RepID=UPI0035EDA36E
MARPRAPWPAPCRRRRTARWPWPPRRAPRWRAKPWPHRLAPRPPGGCGSRAGPAVAALPEASAGAVPERLPEQVVQGYARPGRLYVQASSFTNRADAQRQAARIGGARVEPFGPPRRPEYRVRLGPFTTPGEADRALEMVHRSGVSEARILVD